MDQLLDDAMLFRRQRLHCGASVLCVQLAQVHDDILDASLLDAVGRRRDELARHQHATALELGDANVRLPGVLGKASGAPTDDALLQRVLCGPGDAALHRRWRGTVRLQGAIIRAPSQNVLLGS